jgi:hypothetical protein
MGENEIIFIEIKPNKSEYYVEPGDTPTNLYNIMQGFEV